MSSAPPAGDPRDALALGPSIKRKYTRNTGSLTHLSHAPLPALALRNLRNKFKKDKVKSIRR